MHVLPGGLSWVLDSSTRCTDIPRGTATSSKGEGWRSRLHTCRVMTMMKSSKMQACDPLLDTFLPRFSWASMYLNSSSAGWRRNSAQLDCSRLRLRETYESKVLVVDIMPISSMFLRTTPQLEEAWTRFCCMLWWPWSCWRNADSSFRIWPVTPSTPSWSWEPKLTICHGSLSNQRLSIWHAGMLCNRPRGPLSEQNKSK